MTRNYWSRLALTSVLGVILSYTFVFIAALPIRYLRIIFGRKIFLLSSLASTAMLVGFGLWQWAIVYASICLLIGSYTEFEEKNVSIFLAASFAVIGTATANILVLFGYAKMTGVEVQNFLVQKSEPIYEQLKQIPRFKDVSVDNVLSYLPSGILITMMVILFVSLTASRTPLSFKRQLEMRMFRLPDILIWIFIGSLGGTFVKTSIPVLSLISMNVLAVCLAAYFFQGLAVLTHFMDRLSIFGFWRFLAYFLAFFQLFFLISGLGILDYWFDFRVHGLTGSDDEYLKEVK